MKQFTTILCSLAPLLAALGANRVVADPLSKKEDIRFVNSMREIAQPYHADLDKGGRLFLQSVRLQGPVAIDVGIDWRVFGRP